MKFAFLFPVFASIASAEYAITDLLGNGGGQPTQPTQAGAVQSSGLQVQPPAFSTPETPQPSFAAPLSNGAPVGGASPNANPMAMLAKLANPMASAAASHGPFSGGALSQDSMEVVSGLVEAFMHKVRLEAGERSCLENNVRQASGDLMGTVGDIVTAVRALIDGKGTVQKSAAGGLVSAGIDSAMKITGLVTSSMQLIKNCVHGDALKFMNMTAQHMINSQYLEKRFIVNGVDIAHSLADSVVAFEGHNFHRFGTDVGVALRKILLSNANNATRLPEGMPQQEIIREATDGLFEGFFAAGSAVQISDEADPNLNIVIDLHQCIAGNSGFFKEIWLAAWSLIAQLSANGHQHGLGVQRQGGQPKWEGELMVAMMQFPTALANCGVAQDMQTMFTEAVKSLNDIHVHFQFPRDQFGATSTTDEMAKAVEAWTNWNFKAFGYELGKLLRELLVLALPQKYSVDASGRLRRYTEAQTAIDRAESSRTGLASFMIGGFTFVFVALALIRTHRSRSHTSNSDLVMSDPEDGSCMEVAE